MKSFLLLLAGASFIVSALTAAEPRWNILHIISDDLRDSLGCYGNPVVKSPNIDRLAARGMRFDRAYCNYPVCNPSRASFMSGLRPETIGVLDNVTPTRAHQRDHVFLPELFRRNGYRTIKVGKIYHTGDAFEDPRSWDTDIRENETAKSPPEKQILRRQGPDGIVLRAKDEDTWEGIVARRAVALMEEAAQGAKPFYVAAGFRMPHRPYIAPEKYFALYNPDELSPRPGPAGHMDRLPKQALTYQVGGKKFPDTRPGDTIAAYYAAISYMDAQVGVILAALDRLKLWDRTIVVFQSDHGYHLGEHGGLWHKMTLFEETTRVPMIVAVPGKKPGASLGLVEAVDLYPTLAGLCGLSAPKNLEGTNFAPLLDDPARPWKRAVFTVVTRASGADQNVGSPSQLGRTVFDGRWRYAVWPDGTAQLHDHHHDPFEYENLVSAPNGRSHLERMKQMLAAGWKAALPPMP
jgi:iduronate 2-sulfatase